jgi:hypothetical protein
MLRAHLVEQIGSHRGRGDGIDEYPEPAISFPSDLVSAMTPAFAALQALAFGVPSLPATSLSTAAHKRNRSPADIKNPDQIDIDDPPSLFRRVFLQRHRRTCVTRVVDEDVEAGQCAKARLQWNAHQ